MYGNIILESVKEYIPNYNTENHETYDLIIGTKIKVVIFLKIVQTYIFIYSKVNTNDSSILLHEISEKIKSITGQINIIYISEFKLEEQEKILSGFIRKCKRVNSFTEIDKTNGNVLFSVNKELQNKVFSERYGFLLKEYKFANKDNWHNEVNNFYNVCVEIGKK